MPVQKKKNTRQIDPFTMKLLSEVGHLKPIWVALLLQPTKIILLPVGVTLQMTSAATTTTFRVILVSTMGTTVFPPQVFNTFLRHHAHLRRQRYYWMHFPPEIFPVLSPTTSISTVKRWRIFKETCGQVLRTGKNCHDERSRIRKNHLQQQRPVGRRIGRGLLVSRN